MTHPRKRVRKAFASVLAVALEGEATVYTFRGYVASQAELPVVRIHTPSDEPFDEALEDTVIPSQRTVRIVCEVIAEGAEGASEDSVDDLCELIENALEANPTLSDVCAPLAYKGSDSSLSSDGDQGPLVNVRMTFETVV